MQLNITISESDSPAVIKRAIAALEGFAGLQSVDLTMDKHHADLVARLADMPSILEQEKQRATAAAAVPSVASPLPDAGTFGKIGPESPLYVPSTVAAVPSPTAPVVPQASSPEPNVPPAPALPTVPAATAPTAPAAPTTHASGVAIDKAGLPWDARIHSNSKAINADGTWRKRKGLNDEGLVKRIEAELLAAMAVPAAPVATLTYDDPRGSVTIPIPTANGEMPAIVPSIPAPTEVPVVAVPFVAPPPAIAAVAQPEVVSGATATAATALTGPSQAIPTAPPTTLAELMPRITGAMMTGALPGTALLDVIKAPPFGIPDLPTLAHRPDLIPQVWSVLQQTYPGVLM